MYIIDTLNFQEKLQHLLGMELLQLKEDDLVRDPGQVQQLPKEENHLDAAPEAKQVPSKISVKQDRVRSISSKDSLAAIQSKISEISILEF